MKADTQADDVLSFAEDARLNKIVYSIEQDELHRWATAVIKKRAEHDENEEKKQEEAQLNRGSMLWRVITLGYGSTGPAQREELEEDLSEEEPEGTNEEERFGGLELARSNRGSKRKRKSVDEFFVSDEELRHINRLIVDSFSSVGGEEEEEMLSMERVRAEFVLTRGSFVLEETARLEG